MALFSLMIEVSSSPATAEKNDLEHTLKLKPKNTAALLIKLLSYQILQPRKGQLHHFP